jgi:hypothetical protein
MWHVCGGGGEGKDLPDILGKLEGGYHLRRHRRRWGNNIKIGL